MNHGQAFIVLLIVLLMIPSALSISTSSDINIHIPGLMDIISFNSKFDSVYPNQYLTFDLSINVLKSEEELTLKKLISSNYDLEITNGNGKRMTFWDDIIKETYPIPSESPRTAKTQPTTGHILRKSGGESLFLYLWEISGNSNEQIATLKIASNSNDYYISAGDKLILESPYIKVPYDSALGSSLKINVLNPDMDKLGSQILVVKDRGDVVLTILKESAILLSFITFILTLFVGSKLSRRRGVSKEGKLIVSGVAFCVPFIFYYIVIWGTI